MSGTPQTDDIARGNHVVPTEWAQQLERERDEAREELHDIRINLGEDADGFTLFHAVCALQNERDEARESTLRIDVLNFKLRKELDDAKSKIKSQADRIRYLEGATNHAGGTPLKIALRERDEANEDLHKQLVQFDQLFDEAEKIRIERDEAREEGRRLKAILDLIKKGAQ